MHSKIYQIGTELISYSNYVDPSYFYDEASSFGADYIGESLNDEARHEYIENLANSLNDIFDFDGECLIYKGKEPMQAFIRDWYTRIRILATSLNDEKLDTLELWKMQRAIEGTHQDRYSRFFIEDWNGYAGTFADFIEYVYNHLDEGDRLYFGAVIDYHI